MMNCCGFCEEFKVAGQLIDLVSVGIGGSKEGGTIDARPSQGPNSFIFMYFSAKNLQNNRLAHPL